MNATTLYQKSASTGRGKIWIIRVDDKGTQSEIVIQSGQVDLDALVRGKLVTNTAIVSVGKNAGKANETTHYTQAVSEVQSKIASQIRAGYGPDPQKAKISSSSTLGSGIPQCMLANKYHPTGAQKSSKTLKQMKIEGKKIIVQRKYDGNRCLALVKNNNGKITTTLFTRKGDIMPVQLAHVVADISAAASVYGLQGELVLDGELYCDPTIMSFNVLNGLIKRQTATKEQEAQRKAIKLNLYDVMTPDGYEVRKEIIKKFSSNNVQVVESKEIIATDENIQTELEKYLAEGYEGLMIRVLGIGYENKRSWQLVKCKLFEDREFRLIDFIEDIRTGFVGTFVLELPEKLLKELGKPLVDANGKPITDFKAGASGQSVEDRTYMLQRPEEFLGKMATVEYFGWDYRPRFGKFKSVRDDM